MPTAGPTPSASRLTEVAQLLNAQYHNNGTTKDVLCRIKRSGVTYEPLFFHPMPQQYLQQHQSPPLQHTQTHQPQQQQQQQ